MMKRLIINDFRKNKLITIATTCFMMISAMMLGLSILLFGSLWNSIDRLMVTAGTPDFLQMHSGEIDESNLAAFEKQHPDVEKMQICTFLNLENGSLSIGEESLAESTQDNGLCVQNKDFDYLVGTDGKKLEVLPSEVYVPICYKKEYQVEIGEIMQIGSRELRVAGFLRDSQMNSMMSSSKRFLVNELDYNALRDQGEEEYLIEFKLTEGANVNAFASAYADAGLPGNGPTITFPLIKMMNALSDGMMILVILLVSIVILAISILCIRYILLTSLEKDKREIGMLKAVGISDKDIQNLYFLKFIILSAAGAVLGEIGAYLISIPLGRQMKILYGMPEHMSLVYLSSIIGTLVIECIILLSVNRTLRRLKSLSTIEILRGSGKVEKRRNRYLFIGFITAAAVALMLIPQNMASTLASPKFVTFMGIGESQIRIDVRQSDKIAIITKELLDELAGDERLAGYVVMETGSYRVEMEDHVSYNLLIEKGNHGKYPVRYGEGTYPKETDEIALSNLNAKELGIGIGDEVTVYLRKNDQTEAIRCRVSGIYSDVTNGGKTAKASFDPQIDDTPTMWSILYVNLLNEYEINDWVKEYQAISESLGKGIKVTDIQGYVESTYGQTIHNIRNASFLALFTSALVLWIVVFLFLRLLIWQERRDCSFKKALGFTSSDIRKAFLKKTCIYILCGIGVGIFTGLVPGQMLAGKLLGTLGASGFKFILNPVSTFVITPLLVLVVAITAARISLREVDRIKAYECCVGQE